jgi:hypothetical protein
VAHKGEMKNIYKVLVGKLDVKKILEDLGMDRKTVLKLFTFI